MTRRDYVLLAKALGIGFGELANLNKRDNGPMPDGTLLPPSDLMKGYVAAMGSLAMILMEDNGRFSIEMFFKNISEVASKVCGDTISLDVQRVDNNNPLEETEVLH